MALKWVQAIQVVTRNGIDGKRFTYHPGDWFQARNMEIKTRLAAGQIAIFADTGDARIFEPNECGIVTPVTSLRLDKLGAAANTLSITNSAEPIVPYLYTFYYTGGKFREEMIPIAFELLRKWEMAIPIESFNILASSIGSREEKAYTLEIIGDLRIPVYDVKQVYFRKCSATFALVECWKEEMARFTDPVSDKRMAFLRALYLNPLLILALPPSWRTGITKS